MFPPRYFPVRYASPRYFPPGTGGSGVIYVSVSDSVGLSDVLNTSSSLVRVLSDSVGLTDSQSGIVILIRTIQDNVGVSDTSSRQLGYTRTVVDILTPQDVVSRVYSGKIALVDTLGISDEVSKGQFRSIVDSFGLSDVATTARTITRLLHDSVGPMDASTDVLEAIRSIASQLGVSEEVAVRFRGVSRELEDIVGLSDAVNVGFLTMLLLSDTVGLSDSVVAFLRETDTPCIVDLSVVGQSDIINAIRQGTPWVRTASGLLIPMLESTDRVPDGEIVEGTEVGSPVITGRKSEGGCNG